MKQVFFRPLVVFALIVSISVPILADTIRLKDGSVIRGQIVSFKNEQFTILVGAGARGRRSRITVYMEDVESIEFDGAGMASGPGDDNSTGNNSSSNTNTQPTYQPPTTIPSNQTRPTPSTANTESQTSNSGRGASTNQPVSFQVNTRVRADNANNGWSNTGLVVRRGQRLKITATGRVSLGRDPRTGNLVWSNADGIVREDKDKLVRGERTGGLIAVIGDDNDDFIFVGSSHDFVAQHDGVLFLGINEGNLSDNTGSLEVVIEAETVSGGPPRR